MVVNAALKGQSQFKERQYQSGVVFFYDFIKRWGAEEKMT